MKVAGSRTKVALKERHSLQESRVNAASPRTISVDKKKISSGTQGSVACAILVVASYKEGIFWKRYRFEECLLLSPAYPLVTRILTAQISRSPVRVTKYPG